MTFLAENIDEYFAQFDQKQINLICKPLEEHFGLTSFVYRKIYNDGTEITLTNQPAWSTYAYKTDLLLKESAFDKHPDNYESGVILWSQLKGHTTILNEARKFGIDHGVTIIYKQSDGVELCFFGTKPDRPEVIKNYINNIDLLGRFVLYFKEECSEMLKLANQNRIVIPGKFDKVTAHADDLKIVKQHVTRADFLKATELQEFHFDGKCAGLALSTTEIRIIEHLVKGMTSEEIGKAIFRSTRTVEDSLGKLREKFHVKTKSQLIQKLKKSDFMCYLPKK